MATRATNLSGSKQGNLGRSSPTNSGGNMGNTTGGNEGFIILTIILTLLICLILPFEIYLYIIVKDAVAMCYRK